ncbi:MAG: AAA family ATPase [Candidatus Micrarchaeaceae archaeon]
MTNTIVITGTPCTGKTRLAKLLSKKIKGSVLISANDVAKKGFVIGKDKRGSFIIDLKGLEKALNKIVSERKYGTVIIEGHLLCDIKIKNAKAIVLREHLEALMHRQEKRKYAKEKILENIVAEATDYCGQHAEEHYKEVYELLSSGRSLYKKALSIANGTCRGKQNERNKQKEQRIELLGELFDIMKKERRFAI